MKVYMPYHLGCGNRGCEGIARGIAKVLNLNKSQVVLFDFSSNEYQGDLALELNDIGELRCPQQEINFEIRRLVSRAFQKIGISFFYENLMSNYYIRDAKPGDWLFITGGDIYCYEGAGKLPNLIVKKAKMKGINTALFGVSMEKKFLTSDIVSGLRNFDVITTRETLSSNTLKNLGLANYLFPDPAFSLTPKECDLPDYFKRKVVGINFSSFTDTDTLFNESMSNLIEYLLGKNYEVCLIPHVLWKDQDDRIVMGKFKDKYKERIHVLKTEKMSYLEIRYAISKCKYFIGGRTHSVISAYSTGVPCLALGYSVKAIGIAKDLGLPDYTVINSKKLKNGNHFVESFKSLEDDEKRIKTLYEGIPNYISELKHITEIIKL